MKKWILAAAMTVLVPMAPAAWAIDAATFVKKDQFLTVRLSPTGEYLAMTVPLEDKTGLVILRRSDKKIVSGFSIAGKSFVQDIWWVSPTRVLLNMAQKFAGFDKPFYTGEIYGVNANGGGAKLLIGYRAGDGRGGSRLSQHGEDVFAEMVDPLPGDERYAVIATRPFNDSASLSYSTAERLDVNSGRHVPITKAPVRDASYTTDLSGAVRLALGSDDFGKEELYHRLNDDAQWTLIHEQSADSINQTPIGFSADNRIAYLRTNHDEGPDSIVAFDTQTSERKQVFRNDHSDPDWYIEDPTTRSLVGVGFTDGKPRMAFFDEKSPVARFYRSMEAAFPGQTIFVNSATSDGNLVLVETISDRNPGDFYLYNRTSKKADYVISRKQELDPGLLGERVPVSVKARDGLSVRGYITYPANASRTALPMVVMPHGGPFGVEDKWWYDRDAEMLAAQGYAVLQLNFRGSRGSGKSFITAGYRQWGKAMQDDLTDATRWAIQQGIADSKRVCIFGASYGGYAALMGVAKEPGLYRCAAGYVGVYDLPMMHERGAATEKTWGKTYLDETLGHDGIEAMSPVRLAGQIKVPVFLAAAGGDETAPIKHTKRMEQALKRAGVPVETLYYPNESHGFFDDAHELEFYNRLLAFLARNIGDKSAAPAAAGSN